MIELRNTTASYDTKEVLHDISLTIQQGECVALTGANGAGKTTLLKVISGAVRSKGTTLINGKPVLEMSGSERASIISVVPQDIAYETPLKGHDFVMLGRTHCIPRFAPPTSEDQAAVNEAMNQTSTLELKDRFLSDMSGGERQRLALAMAFAAQPRIILLDEATAHLDLHHRAGIMQLLREMNRNQGVTILMAAHDLSLASRYFERLIMLREGAVLKDGQPKDVLQEPILQKAYGCQVRVIDLPGDLGAAIIPLSDT